ncbi:hypothetical protein B296_00053167, partial [Ensete ventricosum]
VEEAESDRCAFAATAAASPFGSHVRALAPFSIARVLVGLVDHGAIHGPVMADLEDVPDS